MLGSDQQPPDEGDVLLFMSFKKITAAAVHRGRKEQKQGKQLEGNSSSPERDNNDLHYGKE